MAESMTQFLQKKLLDHSLGIASWTMPTAVYLCAFTADPGETGSFDDEVDAADYERLDLTSHMAPAVLGTGIASNDEAVTFPAATEPWGAITHMGIADASTGGNLLYKNAMGSTRTIDTADVLDFKIGNIQGRLK